MGLTRKDQLEHEKLEAEARKATLEGDELVLKIENLSRSLKWLEARSGENPEQMVYTFDSSVDNDTVRLCMETLTLWTRRHPGANIKLIFNSPGGYVISGFALFDFLLELRSQGHHVETVALGMAASMAGILLQAGDTRVVGPNSWMLIHEVSAGALGTTSEMEDAVAFTKRLQNQILDIFAERATVTRETIKRRWKKTDWWLNADEMVKYGFADEIRA